MIRWIGGTAAMIALTAAAVFLARMAAPETGRRMIEAVAAFPAGWGLALVNAAAGYAVNRRALRGRGNEFLLWAVGANALRTLLLLAIIAVFLLAGVRGREAFLAAVFSGYFVFLTAEVRDLYQAGQGEK